VILAALDPIWRGDGSPRCAVQRVELARKLAAGDVLAVARAGDAARRMQELLPAAPAGLELVARGTSPSFVFLGLEQARPGAAPGP
jgi:hypothetical protein